MHAWEKYDYTFIVQKNHDFVNINMDKLYAAHYVYILMTSRSIK